MPRERLPCRESRRTRERERHGPTRDGEYGEVECVFQRAKVACHLVDQPGRAHLPVHGAEYLGLVVERLHHGLTDATGRIDPAE